MEQDAVLAGAVHLDDGVAGAACGLLHKPGVDACPVQRLLQKMPLRPDEARVPSLHPGPRQSHGLVQPLAARVLGIAFCESVCYNK